MSTMTDVVPVQVTVHRIVTVLVRTWLGVFVAAQQARQRLQQQIYAMQMEQNRLENKLKKAEERMDNLLKGTRHAGIHSPQTSSRFHLALPVSINELCVCGPWQRMELAWKD
jgi:hypothetical protein